jgi:hypothetical protein
VSARLGVEHSNGLADLISGRVRSQSRGDSDLFPGSGSEADSWTVGNVVLAGVRRSYVFDARSLSQTRLIYETCSSDFAVYSSANQNCSGTQKQETDSRAIQLDLTHDSGPKFLRTDGSKLMLVLGLKREKPLGI